MLLHHINELIFLGGFLIVLSIFAGLLSSRVGAPLLLVFLGLGLGLAFSRWATEANQGRIYARNLPDVGRVFTIDLPRCPVPALALA